MRITHRQEGSVSLFIVIFAALLIITIATAFIRIVLQDQGQATANDLSKSALDSAYAGVEDSKRAIVEYYSVDAANNKPDCSTAAGTTNDRCIALKAALVGDVANDGWTANCDATTKAGVAERTGSGAGEVLVKSNGNDADDDLNQAYTCVKIKMNPTSIAGTLGTGTSDIIRLKSKDNAPFNQIKIQWYAYKNQSASLIDEGAPPYKLSDDWPTNRPAVMRAQLLQYKPNFHLSDFDGNFNFNSTLFFLPSKNTGVGGVSGAEASFADDKRLDDDGHSNYSSRNNVLQSVACHDDVVTATSSYACDVTINLPDWNGDPSAAARTAYLRLSQFYSSINNDYLITMLDTKTDPTKPTEVRSADVQAVVDSTGRANDIFRRIQSRVNFGVSSVPNAEAAIDITKSLCKEFSVTNDRAYADNSNGSNCPAPPN